MIRSACLSVLVIGIACLCFSLDVHADEPEPVDYYYSNDTMTDDSNTTNDNYDPSNNQQSPMYFSNTCLMEYYYGEVLAVKWFNQDEKEAFNYILFRFISAVVESAQKGKLKEAVDTDPLFNNLIEQINEAGDPEIAKKIFINLSEYVGSSEFLKHGLCDFYYKFEEELLVHQDKLSETQVSLLTTLFQYYVNMLRASSKYIWMSFKSEVESSQVSDEKLKKSFDVFFSNKNGIVKFYEAVTFLGID